MDSKTDFIKCAFCEWKTPRWTTTKGGNHRNGGARLLNHVEMTHHDDYLRIRRTVDAYKQMEENYDIG